MVERKLGARLRALRIEKGISVRTLAAQTGFSPSFISQLESDSVSPSISSLDKIASFFGITLGELFSSLEVEPRRVIRAGERSIHHSGWSKSEVATLTDAGAGRKLSAMAVTFQPGGSSGSKPAPALQDTFAYMVDGEMTLVQQDGEMVLSVGDAVYLRDGDLYCWRNVGATSATLMLVTLATRAHPLADLIVNP